VQGDGVSLVQELPIGKPCPSNEIDSLVAAKDVASLCPWYLDLASGAGAAGLARVVDRMKALSSSMQVALCKVRQGSAGLCCAACLAEDSWQGWSVCD
jgi:hypothetical protein